MAKCYIDFKVKGPPNLDKKDKETHVMREVKRISKELDIMFAKAPIVT